MWCPLFPSFPQKKERKTDRKKTLSCCTSLSLLRQPWLSLPNTLPSSQSAAHVSAEVALRHGSGPQLPLSPEYSFDRSSKTMTDRHVLSDSPRHPRSPSESPAASSGALTPPESSASNSTFLSSSMSGIWGGLVRRFSSDTTTQFNSPPKGHHGPLHHSHTSPLPSAENNGIDGVYTPPQIHRTASPLRPPPLEPLVLKGFRDDTTAEARLLTTTIAEELRIMVPARLTIVDEWNLVYSLDQDGASLTTLYEKCAHYEGRRVGFVLAVKDCEGGVSFDPPGYPRVLHAHVCPARSLTQRFCQIFGGYLSEFPHPAAKYFGTGECFLWRASVMASLPPPPSADTTHLTGRSTTIASSSSTSVQSDLLSPANSEHFGTPVPPSPSIRFKAFPYSGVNEYYMLCEAHFLSMGAGDGKYGLWLDDGLVKGISSTSLTFGNEQLSDEGEKFGILGVEMWVIGASGP